MTERLYFADSYLSAFDANVTRETDGGTRIYLDRTAFYPTSGGQPNDLGTCNGIRVLDVIDENESIAHVVSQPLNTQTVHCAIDWPRRYDHMQQHTGQHLLSAVLSELFSFETLSFHMGSEISTIELATAELSDGQIDQAQRRAAEVASEGRLVQVAFESSDAATGLRKQSARSGLLRIVSIPGSDRSACGGTHVRSTAEVTPMLIRRQEKVRGNIRVEFVCGLRALHQATSDFRLLQVMARQAGVPQTNLPATFESLSERLKESEKERTRISIDGARREASSRWESIPASDDGFRRLVIPVPTIDDGARAFAQSFVDRGRAAFAAVCRKPPSLLFTASADSGINAGALLKAALEKHGGRGGGSQKMAQGTVPRESDLEAILILLGFPVNATQS